MVASVRAGSNSNEVNGRLDRLEFLRKPAIDAGTLEHTHLTAWPAYAA
ncbi:hypothetical protein LJR235_001141 [Pararhizobium sp. LjRoot235]